MTRIEFEAVDRRQWDRTRRRIREMAERARDVSPAWQAVATWFAEANFEQFLSRGARYRDPWPPLAASTTLEKLARGFPLDPLIRTGDLVQDLTSRPFGVEQITPHEMTVGTAIPYAGFHQRGTSRMPRRVLFDAGQIRREQVATTAIANWIIRGEARVGGRTVLRGAR